jgi:hypothetical protein
MLPAVPWFYENLQRNFICASAVKKSRRFSPDARNSCGKTGAGAKPELDESLTRAII